MKCAEHGLESALYGHARLCLVLCLCGGRCELLKTQTAWRRRPSTRMDTLAGMCLACDLRLDRRDTINAREESATCPSARETHAPHASSSATVSSSCYEVKNKYGIT